MKTVLIPKFLTPDDFQRLIVAEVAPLWLAHEHYRLPAFRWKLDFPNNHYAEVVNSYRKMYERAYEGAVRRDDVKGLEEKIKKLGSEEYAKGCTPNDVIGWHIPAIGVPGVRS